MPLVEPFPGWDDLNLVILFLQAIFLIQRDEQKLTRLVFEPSFESGGLQQAAQFALSVFWRELGATLDGLRRRDKVAFPFVR